MLAECVFFLEPGPPWTPLAPPPWNPPAPLEVKTAVSVVRVFRRAWTPVDPPGPTLVDPPGPTRSEDGGVGRKKDNGRREADA